MNIEKKQALLLDLIKASLVSYHVFATVVDELSNELNIISTVKIKEILEAVLEEGKVNGLPEEDIDLTLYIYTKHSLELIATLIDAIGICEGERITKSLIEYSDYLHNRILDERITNKHTKLAKFKDLKRHIA